MLKLNNKILIALIAVLYAFNVTAQSGIGVFGNTYIHSNSEIGVHSKMYFNSGSGDNAGIVITNRNAESPGMVSFMKSDSWENAADDRHIDGYCKIYSDEAFTFPVGDMGYFKPISISGAAGTSAAYVYGDAIAHYDFDQDLKAVDLGTVSDKEYWIINGSSSTTVTLHWDDNSELATFVDHDIQNLRIVGWNGTSWEVIPSIIDDTHAVSNGLNSGSITTEYEITPDNFEVITFGSVLQSVRADSDFGSTFNGEQIDLTVFPNPTISLSNLNLDYNVSDINADIRIVVIDGAGQMIYNQEVEESNAIVQLPYIEHAGGTYQIGIMTSNGSKTFRSVIVAPE